MYGYEDKLLNNIASTCRVYPYTAAHVLTPIITSLADLVEVEQC